MRSHPVVAGVSIVVVVVLVALASRYRVHRKPAPQVAGPAPAQARSTPAPIGVPAPPPVHGEHRLVAQILEQGLTPERAKLLFSMVVGPLPGVSVPAESRNPADWDGTLAVSYLGQEWDSLTPAQRAVATQLINRSGQAPGGQRSSLPSQRPMVVPVAYVRTAGAPAFNYQALADTANSTLAVFLGKPPVSFSVAVDYGQPSGTEWAHTTSWTKPEDLVLSSCYLLVWNQKFTPLSYTDAQAVITHEMVHCYQQRETGSPEAAMSVHPWVAEGEATWVMQVVVPGVSDFTMDSCWAPYLTQPTTHFAKRSYDAVGVYAHQADIGGNETVWPKLLPMVTMAMGGGPGDINAFNFLTAGNQITYFTNWGSSYFEVEQNTPWDMLNRYPASGGGPSAQSVVVDGGTGEMLPSAANYESELFQLTGSADIAVVSLLTGYGRIHDQAFAIDEALDVSAPLALCLKQGGCKCPDGSPGASLFTTPAAAPVSIGINGGETTGQVGVVGETLDKFCKKPDPPIPPGTPPPGNGGGSGGPPAPDQQPPPPPQQGESRGDTHVVTIDGLHYDFQVVGEYTLVRSTKDDFVVQVRMVPVRNSHAASMNQAIATKLNGHRVTVSIQNATEVLRVDGKDTFGKPLPAPLRRAVLCTQTMYGSSCQLTWPDGTIVRATQIEAFALDVAVQPARSRLGTLVGLLGDGNGSPGNDLVGTGGAQLGAQPNPQDINHSLASAWRIKPAASLFDYLPGQSSRTFADTTFPRAGADRSVNRDSAEKVCRQEGITDAHLLDDCILDLAVTNNFAYASVYSHAQRVADAQAVLGQTQTRGVLRSMVMDGTITDKSQQPLFTFQAADSNVMWIDSAGCKDANGTIRVHPLWHAPRNPSTTWDDGRDELPAPGARLESILTVPACRLGRVNLLAGTIALLANPSKDEEGAFHIPVRLVRHNRVRAITYGTTVDGDIENPGVQDLYTFIGHPGDIIRISGDSCDIGNMVTGIAVPDGYAEQGPLCSGGDFTLPTGAAHAANDSTYQLTVNWVKNAGPAKYHFVFRGTSMKSQR